MKIRAKNTGMIFSFDPKNRSEEERYTCPQCSEFRKKKTDKCLAWNNKDGIAYCHNCGETFYVYRPNEAKQYVLPEWKNKTDLTDSAVKYFTGRMISQNTLNKIVICVFTIFEADNKTFLRTKSSAKFIL